MEKGSRDGERDTIVALRVPRASDTRCGRAYGVVSMQQLGSIVPAVLRKRGLFDHAESSQGIRAAQEWLERELPGCLGALTAVKIRDGVLWVSCRHSIAAQECQAAGRALFDYLRAEMPEMAVSELRIVRERPREDK